MEDHPRIHGEHKLDISPCAFLTGSPPHTRGTLSAIFLMCHLQRITPAYTGNTQSARFSSLTAKDHPRIHGEHNALEDIESTNPGSPPHTRGTPSSFL